jgi:hypothetical protein
MLSGRPPGLWTGLVPAGRVARIITGHPRLTVLSRGDSTQAGADRGATLEEDNRRALLEGNIDHVIGVDTHRDAHAAAILDCSGGLLAQLELPRPRATHWTRSAPAARR